MTAETTPELDAAGLVSRLRDTFATGRTRDLAWRDAQLAALVRLLAENQQTLVDALHADLGRPPMEAWVADVRASSATSGTSASTTGRGRSSRRCARRPSSYPAGRPSGTSRSGSC